MTKKLREINTIYIAIDGYNEIKFPSDQILIKRQCTKSFFRSYNKQQICNIFRIMGCMDPLNISMADWIFNFLERATDEQAAELFGIGTRKIFHEPRSCAHNYIILSRNELHRIVGASLYVHQMRKVRYSIDFRIAMDFIEERRFFIILLSGAPGTGKSTIASLLASRMSVTHIVSTDSIRHAMRTIYPKEKYPILHCSTYECGDIVDPEHKLSYEERVCILFNSAFYLSFLCSWIYTSNEK